MLVRIFEDQVKKTPHRIVIRAEKVWLSYDELNRCANRIALLIEENWSSTGKSDQVGLLFDHGPDMIAAVLGTLKAGKVYVPLSTDYPDLRISYMLTNSQSALLLTHSRHAGRSEKLARQNNIDFIVVDQPGGEVPDGDREREIKTGQLAYIMYTSGSTGRPKGVMQTHENVVYYTRGWTARFSITSEDRMTLFSSFCHDGSVQDIFAALHSGAALYPYDMKTREESGALSEFLIKERITIWHSVPSLYSFFAGTLTGKEQFRDLRFILLGGEPVRQHEVNMLKKCFHYSTLANVYGQTESSVNSIQLIGQADHFDRVLIGDPLDETEIFVIDEKGKPVQPLELGEILVACAHISPGYWGNEEASRQCFSENQRFGRLYWTGDLGCLLPDNGIEFLGRKDFQVKIRGFRIEPGEIENRLLDHPRIKEAVVTLRHDDQGDAYLCAYILAKAQRHNDTGGGIQDSNPRQGISGPELREFLSRALPSYMIPTCFVCLDSFPLTQSGKIDRQALPAPELRTTGQQYVPPADEVEQGLLEIWSRVLGIEKGVIGIDDDFFQHGGHSLRAVSMAVRVHKEFGLKIPLPEVFKHPSIRDLSTYIKETGVKEKFAQVYSTIEPVEKKEYYLLSPAQQRFCIMQQLDPESTLLNMPMMLYLSEDVEAEKLVLTFKKLIRRHEALRTSFEILDDQPVQKIHDQVEFEVEYYSMVVKNFSRAFDLSRAPLLRLGLLKTQEKYILLVDMHHIISDGTSNTILSRDFQSLYTGEELPHLRLQYKDFSAWQHNQFRSGRLKADEDYWLERLQGRLPLLHLPTDYPRPQARSSAGTRFRAALGMELTGKIQQLLRQTGTTLYMVLLSAYSILLSRYSGQQDIIVGTPVAGRSHADLESVIGLVIGSVLMRSFPSPQKFFIDFLQEVKASTLEAFEHQAYPFEELLKRLDWQEKPGRNPITDVALIVQNMMALPGGGIDTANPDKDDTARFLYTTSKQDITLYAVETAENIILVTEYSTTLFKHETMQRFVAHLINLLELVVEEPGIQIAHIDVTSLEEKTHIIGSPERCYPLSHAQTRIYYTEKIYPATPCYNVSFIVRYPRMLDKRLLEQAINQVLKKNEALRLRIVELDFQEEPLQYISAYKPYHLDEVDLSGSPQAQQWLQTECKKLFRLVNGDLFYFAYVKFNDRESGFFMKMHHLVTDGWTRLILVHEITEIYENLKTGEPVAQFPYPSYIEYLSDEREYLISSQAARDRDFWHCTLLPLPGEVKLWQASPEKRREIEAGAKTIPFSRELRSKLHQYCKAQTTSIFKVVLSALALYICRLSGEDDMVIGSFNHNRTTGDHWHTTGMFVSTLPLRIGVDQQMDFQHFVDRVSQEINYILKNHQKYPFDRLSWELSEKTGLDAGSLLNINLIGHPDFKEDRYRMEYLFPGYEPSALSIHININNKDIHGILEVHYYYQFQKFSEADIGQLHRCLVQILEDGLGCQKKRLREIELVSAEEKAAILYHFNDTLATHHYPEDRLIQQLIEDQVHRTPDRISLVGPGACGGIPGQVQARDESMYSPADQVTLSYRQLYDRANQLAQILLERGVGANTIVSMLVKPSLEMAVAILGILKTGGAYLPIEPQNPAGRISYMLADSGAQILLTCRSLFNGARKPGSGPGETIFVEEIGTRQEVTSNAVGVQAAGRRLPVDCLAYIIYTSGSTGRPKGVGVEHRSLLAYIEAFAAEFRLAEKDIVIQQASYAFDAFVEEFYPILLKGGKLVVAPRAIIQDPNRLVKFIARCQVSMITCSARLLNELNQVQGDRQGDKGRPLQSLRLLISGGDRLAGGYVNHLDEVGTVYNTYGPSETTVCATYHRCPQHIVPPANVPIGKPIANYQVTILDRFGNFLPIGAAGELCISGSGVSRGYLNNPELTAEKFITNRLTPQPIHPGCDSRLYRTGDLGRWLPDGNIEFLGRIDTQVKIRGFRVELGEIEAQLVKHDQIREAVVIDLDDAVGDKYLCAYIVIKAQTHEGTEIKSMGAALRKYLSGQLPDYMIPSHFVPLEKIPLTASGKLERRSLPAPEFKAGEDYAAPRNELEKRLAKIWSEILDLDAEFIGIDHDFFALGGHSLKATRLVSRIQKEFGMKIPLAAVFDASSIRRLAGYMQARKKEPFMDVTEITKDENLVLLKEGVGTQDHLLFIHDGSGEVDGYVELCQHLACESHCWGIRADRLKAYSPQNISFEDTAEKYIRKIQRIQAHGPYRIIGWSIGGTIAFEMVRQLELANEAVEFFAMIDALAPPEDLAKGSAAFTPGSEIDWLKERFPDLDIYKEVEQVPELERMWSMIVNYLESSHFDINVIRMVVYKYGGPAVPNYNHLGIGELIQYLNIMRSFRSAQERYIPAGKITAQVHYFRTSHSEKSRYEKWHEYSCRPLKFYEAAGDHYSVFKLPQVIDFAEKFDQILDRSKKLNHKKNKGEK